MDFNKTCYQRYRNRIWDWEYYEGRVGKFKHRCWWLLHNCVAHPLIGLIPIKRFHDFHDWTSKKLNKV